MSEPVGGYDEARARVGEQAAQGRQRNAELRAVAQEVRSVSGSASSSDGLITVTATTSGAITAMTIGDDALEGGGAALAHELVEIIAAAQRSALVQAAQDAALRLGAAHPMVADLERSAERFARPGSGMR